MEIICAYTKQQCFECFFQNYFLFWNIVIFGMSCSWYSHCLRCHILLLWVDSNMGENFYTRAGGGMKGRYSFVKSTIDLAEDPTLIRSPLLGGFQLSITPAPGDLDILFWILWSPTFTCKYTLNKK